MRILQPTSAKRNSMIVPAGPWNYSGDWRPVYRFPRRGPSSTLFRNACNPPIPQPTKTGRRSSSPIRRSAQERADRSGLICLHPGAVPILIQSRDRSWSGGRQTPAYGCRISTAMNLKTFFSGRGRDAEIGEEIEAHLRMAIRDRMERGESARAARLAALREFGNTALVAETVREVWVWRALEQALEDLRFGLRILTQSPAFAAAAVVMIALGIGGNTAIFSMVNAILMKPMPGVRAGHLVSLGLMVQGRVDDPS